MDYFFYWVVVTLSKTFKDSSDPLDSEDSEWHPDLGLGND